ncbi:MAG: hypothetical protein QM802_10695 [Agriterribacter sp.]
MQRRKFIINGFGAVIANSVLLNWWHSQSSTPFLKNNFITNGPIAPVSIYNNWSSYDELSDNTPLTEALAMRELDEIIRLKKNGVQVDYYVMDAFWFDKKGGYREWHKEHWPNGPGKWFETCQQNDIKPGMWFSTNYIGSGTKTFLEPVAEWKDSLATDPNTVCLFTGGYLKHLSETLQLWYDKGVRLFKFDFAYFEAATTAVKKVHLPDEIREMNKLALMDMLKQFREKNNDILITGYNGFGGDMENTYLPFRKTVDARWMEVFDTMYCGDPRFSDVPAMNVWRSQDIYSDHMVRQFEYNGLPLRRIDNCAFMTGKTGTCYYRAANAWKGMLILELARGGWVNVYHGNMELINDANAKWFARAQQTFFELQRYGLFSTFGAMPGSAMPYGFKAEGVNGAVITIVNPSQSIATIEMPVKEYSESAIMYADGGYKPSVKNKALQLGPEQLVVVGFGAYALEKYNLGIDETIKIPFSIQKTDTVFNATKENTIAATVTVAKQKYIRIIFQQYGADGLPRRSWGGAPPDGKKMDAFMKITVTQGKKNIPLHIEYDKMIWSGLSWAAGEINPKDIDATKPLEIACSSTEKDKLTLRATVYEVAY